MATLEEGNNDHVEYPPSIDNLNIHDAYIDDFGKFKVDAAGFDGKFDLNTFLYWLSSMDKYFDWYEMTNG